MLGSRLKRLGTSKQFELMNLKSIFKNASYAFLAQGVAFFVSAITTLLVPKVLGVEQFSYWQLFIFYQSYVGFFHFGLNDGVYLVYGGTPRAKIDKKSITSQYLFGVCVQLMLGIALLFAIFSADLNDERDFVLFCTVVFMVVKNSADYIGYVFQAMNETMLFSRGAILERLAFLLPMTALLLLQIDDFEVYVVAYMIAGLVRLFYFLYNSKDFFKCGLEPLETASKESVKSITIGLKLMLANIASMLILGVARFFIDLVWGIETFGKLSLSLSMVNFFLAFVSQAAMVLFPALRQGSNEEQRKFFVASRDSLSIIFPAVYALYFPMKWLLDLWLPLYSDSFIFIAYLMPICVFDSKMNICCTTMFKVRRQERMLLLVNIFAFLISACATLLGCYVFVSIYIVIGGVILSIVLRSVVSEFVINHELEVTNNLLLFCSELFLTIAFILAVGSLDEAVGFFVYLLLFFIFVLLNRNRVQETKDLFARFITHLNE